MDVAQLKAVDALLKGDNYSDDVFEKMLSHYELYLESREKLRALPLGDARPAQVMLAGAKR